MIKMLQRNTLPQLKNLLLWCWERFYVEYRAMDRVMPGWLQEGVQSALLWLSRVSYGRKLVRGLYYIHWKVTMNWQYQMWLKNNLLSLEMIEEMDERMKAFSYRPLISILTPVHNVQEQWLRKAVESVRNQIYPHWELCLANDAATDVHIKPILDEYVALDSRIRVEHMPQHAGIAGASGQAFMMSRGEFIGLLDHDDELSVDALWHVVNHLNLDPDIDLLYSDEDKFDLQGNRVEPFFKPDWSPELLLSMNYITHFSVFRRKVFEEAGGFRSGFDGSQDYDLLLRVTERIKHIAHIPKILYHWRKIPGSAASSAMAKPYAYEAGRRALTDAMERKDLEGHVEMVTPGLYLTRYTLRERPLISVIIIDNGQEGLLRRCLQSLDETVVYSPFEMIVVGQLVDEDVAKSVPERLRSKTSVVRVPLAATLVEKYNVGTMNAQGRIVLFLDSRAEVMTREWMTIMVEQVLQSGVGAVGAKTINEYGQIRQAGVILGVTGLAGYAFAGMYDQGGQYFGLAKSIRNCSALSRECLMVSRQAFEKVGGFDEDLRESLFDIDLCLKLREQQYRSSVGHRE